MSQVEINVEVVIGGIEHEIRKILSLQQQEVEALLPIPQEGDTGWAYFNFADEIASKIVAERLFQDHIANKKNSKDLKALGVTKMKAVFSSEALKRSNSVTFIA